MWGEGGAPQKPRYRKDQLSRRKVKFRLGLSCAFRQMFFSIKKGPEGAKLAATKKSIFSQPHKVKMFPADSQEESREAESQARPRDEDCSQPMEDLSLLSTTHVHMQML